MSADLPPPNSADAPLSAYFRWFFAARDAATGLPYGSLILYRVAANDEERFHHGEDLLRIAFAAGFEAGRAPRPVRQPNLAALGLDDPEGRN